MEEYNLIIDYYLSEEESSWLLGGSITHNKL